ncbi:MAG: phosphonate C-P lyase system protein PhnH [Roseinatronobacter sp.]
MTLTLEGGFTNAPAQSARAFRALLTALSQPGTIVTLGGATPPAPLSQAAGIAALVLLDPTTPVHLAGALDCDAVRGWLTFHTGARFVRAEDAAFAIGTWDALQPVSRFAIGTSEYPDRAATLIVEMPALTPAGPTLRGPGIHGKATLSLPETAAFRANRARFPLGFDTFLTCGAQIAGLPRSTIVGDA